MLDADEREGSSRGRLDLLLEQLGANVVSETLEVELEALSGFQSGAAPLEGGVLERLNALGESMGMTVEWWDEERWLRCAGLRGGLAGFPRGRGELRSKQNEEIWVEEKPEHPAHFAEFNTEEFDEKKRLYLEQATEFASHYKQVMDDAQDNEISNDAVMHLADGLRRDYENRLEAAAEYQENFDEDFQKLDAIADAMASLLKEKQPGV